MQFIGKAKLMLCLFVLDITCCRQLMLFSPLSGPQTVPRMPAKTGSACS